MILKIWLIFLNIKQYFMLLQANVIRQVHFLL